MEVTLNIAEIKLAEYLAKVRYASNRAAGVVDTKIGYQDTVYTDLNGMGGELAFCKLRGIYPDTSTEPRSGGYDCIDQFGSTFDIKTTKYPNGRLLVDPKKVNANVQYYVLILERCQLTA